MHMLCVYFYIHAELPINFHFKLSLFTYKHSTHAPC